MNQEFNSYRYDERPFLRLVECYVLSAIDHLDEHQRSMLRQMEPKLSSTYDITGTWIQIVQTLMEFSEELSDEIRAMWVRNVARAKAEGMEIDPEEFVRAFVDHNFPEILNG